MQDNLSYSIGSNYRVQNVKFFKNNVNFEFTQNEYKDLDNFPRKITLKIEADKNFEANISYSKVEFNKPQNIVFKIPDSYNEIK